MNDKELLESTLSKIDTIKEFLINNPIPNTLNEALEDDFRLNYTYDSNAIEGNTLTLMETKVVLEGLTIGGKTLREHFEIINHAEAILFIEDLVKQNKKLDESVIKSIHSLILQNINKQEAGKYRGVQVIVGGFLPPQSFKIRPQMENFISTYNKLSLHSILKASYAHLEFVRIHPFIDGNGRTARLIMNLELLKAGYPAINILSKRKVEYYEAIRQYSNFNNGTMEFDKLISSYVLERLEVKKNLQLEQHKPHKRRENGY